MFHSFHQNNWDFVSFIIHFFTLITFSFEKLFHIGEKSDVPFHLLSSNVQQKSEYFQDICQCFATLIVCLSSYITSAIKFSRGRLNMQPYKVIISF